MRSDVTDRIDRVRRDYGLDLIEEKYSDLQYVLIERRQLGSVPDHAIIVCTVAMGVERYYWLAMSRLDSLWYMLSVETKGSVTKLQMNTFIRNYFELSDWVRNPMMVASVVLAEGPGARVSGCVVEAWWNDLFHTVDLDKRLDQKSSRK
jgi:hypothetical protein